MAYEDGQEIGRSVLLTSGKAAKIHIEVEKDEHYTQLAFFNIELHDKDGNSVFADRKLSIEVSGAAELAAFGSEKAKRQCGYEFPETNTTDGHALAILRLMGEGGISVRVASEGLEDAVVSW